MHQYGGELLKGKTATQSTEFPCIPKCGPDKVVDGDKNTCMKTYEIGQAAPRKTVWSMIDLGETHSIYSISIDFKNQTGYELRQRGRFAGFSLYISDTSKREDGYLCYKNTLPLPPLNFNTTCIGYGRYVIYYNERLEGVKYPEGYSNGNLYTELCEVKIQGCSSSGVYGSNCSIPCPINCQEQRCNIVNGTCLGCVPGYVGQTCKDECNNGTYGPDCIHNCSGHCLNGTTCNKENGFCELSCNPGYAGELYCPKGSFGQNCEEHCSINCISGICDHITGTCVEGCLTGFTGMRCFDCKKIK
ncbi:cell death abnormality protein 1-like [Saccostrea echinata]|uniref:cell death abnormality protein 1-like n=1 Tax=Saccostrea echinata TaxID=191078 RepID=UPI002A8343DB|nr:cell death abnormality protein 1-like [Saccostrea echinata]